MSLQEKLLEELAELEHEQWSHIIGYLNKEHMLSLGKWMSAYYLTLIKKPYSELSEAKKESDREWARKVLKIIDKHCVSKQEIRKLYDYVFSLREAELKQPIGNKSLAENTLEYVLKRLEALE